MPGQVTVACKHPPGLTLRTFRPETETVEVMGGGSRERQIFRPTGQMQKINGPAVPHGVRPAFVIAGGYALTPNVDKDFMDEFMRQNKDTDLVRNKLIFVREKADDAVKMAKEHSDVKSNLEPLNVSRSVSSDGKVKHADPRWPKKANPNMTEIDIDTNKE